MPFQDTKEATTNFCTHTNDSSICDECLGKNTPDTENIIRELANKAHIKWLSKTRTAVIDGAELTVLPYGWLWAAVEEALEQFASTELQAAYKQGQQKPNVGLLRQYLNERTDNELLTDKTLLKFIKLGNK